MGEIKKKNYLHELIFEQIKDSKYLKKHKESYLERRFDLGT